MSWSPVREKVRRKRVSMNTAGKSSKDCHSGDTGTASASLWSAGCRKYVQGGISGGFMHFAFFLTYLPVPTGRAARSGQADLWAHPACFCGYKDKVKGFPAGPCFCRWRLGCGIVILSTSVLRMCFVHHRVPHHGRKNLRNEKLLKAKTIAL